jgi:hypothetical protein
MIRQSMGRVKEWCEISAKLEMQNSVKMELTIN